MINSLTARGKTLLSLILFIAICIAGYWAYEKFTARAVTAESQQQAETPAGVELAAKNAHIYMLQSQLNDAASQIGLLKNKPPETIVKMVPYEVVKVVEKEVEKRGADFAIVTDPKQPDKEVDLKEIEKLPATTPVTLSQYNVFAYKKVIRGINVYPNFTGIKPTGVSEITVDVSRKITDDGKYLGITGGYDFDNKKVKMGLRISF